MRRLGAAQVPLAEFYGRRSTCLGNGVPWHLRLDVALIATCIADTHLLLFGFLAQVASFSSLRARSLTYLFVAGVFLLLLVLGWWCRMLAKCLSEYFCRSGWFWQFVWWVSCRAFGMCAFLVDVGLDVCWVVSCTYLVRPDFMASSWWSVLMMLVWCCVLPCTFFAVSHEVLFMCLARAVSGYPSVLSLSGKAHHDQWKQH